VRIEFSGFPGPHASVSDGGAFSGAAGEPRPSALGDNALLQGDVHGDTVADFTILMMGGDVPMDGDFVLS
jgi:hypothetical protein